MPGLSAPHEALGDAPTVLKDDEEPTARQRLADVLAGRHLATALHLATRRGAAPELAKRALDYLDRAIASEPVEAKKKYSYCSGVNCASLALRAAAHGLERPKKPQ